MIPEIDTLERYKNYMHAGFYTTLFVVAVITYYELYLDIFDWVIFTLRLIMVGSAIAVYFVGLRGITTAIRYLLK